MVVGACIGIRRSKSGGDRIDLACGAFAAFVFWLHCSLMTCRSSRCWHHTCSIMGGQEQQWEAVGCQLDASQHTTSRTHPQAKHNTQIAPHRSREVNTALSWRSCCCMDLLTMMRAFTLFNEGTKNRHICQIFR